MDMNAANRIRFGRFVPRPDTPEGRLLAAGALTVTVTSRKSGMHVTLRFRAKVNDAGAGGWVHSSFERSTCVFITDYDGELVATYLPKDGLLRFERNQTEAVRWTVQSVLRYLSGAFPGLVAVADIDSADFCGVCHKQLDTPLSVLVGACGDCWAEKQIAAHAAA